MRALIAALAFVLPCHAAAQGRVLVDEPVRVHAEAQADGRHANGPTRLAIEVRDRNQSFRFTVSQRGGPEEALATQQRRSGFKDGFLFVRDDCLEDAGDTRRWRCSLDKVFAWAETRDGRRLIYVGDVHAGDDCEQADRVGCAVFERTFSDIYDGLENNALTTHTEAPAILIEMRLKSGEFVVDLDDTWGRNQERYKAGERCLASLAATPRAAQCSDGISPRRAYLFNAALATYARREPELDRTRMHARAALCEGLAEAECSDALRSSALILARVTPGAKPGGRGVVRAARVEEPPAK